MKARLAFFTLLATLSATSVQASDVAKAKELMTLMRADEVTAGILKVGMKRRQAQAGLTDAQLACVNAVPHSDFSDAVTTAISENLSDPELATAIAFYRSPTGTRYVNAVVSMMRGNTPAEQMTEQDIARFKEFSATPAGQKVLNKDGFMTSDTITNRMAEVSGNAIENCGKAAK